MHIEYMIVLAISGSEGTAGRQERERMKNTETLHLCMKIEHNAL
jgi:hypothetical protein